MNNTKSLMKTLTQIAMAVLKKVWTPITLNRKLSEER